MEFEEAAIASGMVRPEHVDELLRALKIRSFAWLVCDPSQQENRLQGDVMRELPVAIVAPDGQPRCKGFTAMVINNACDLQPERSEMVTVAPLQHFDKFAASILAQKDDGRAKQYLDSVRANQIDELLYFPNCPQLPAGAVVRMDRLSSMSAQVYERALGDGGRIASLTQNGFYFFLMKLTRFLCRPESADITRDNPDLPENAEFQK